MNGYDYPQLPPPPPGYLPVPMPPPAPPANGIAVASMVLGITSIVFCWWGLGTLAQVVLAIVFGCIGMGRARHRGMAIAGLICGCVGAIAYLIVGIASIGVGFLI